MDDKQKMYEKNRKHSEALNFRVDKKTYLELTLIAKQRGISRADVCRERLKGLKYEPPLLAEDDRVALIKQSVVCNQLHKQSASCHPRIVR